MHVNPLPLQLSLSRSSPPPSIQHADATTYLPRPDQVPIPTDPETLGPSPRCALLGHPPRPEPRPKQVPLQTRPESQTVRHPFPPEYVYAPLTQPPREGHKDVDSLKEAYKDKIADLRRKASTVATPESDAPAGGPAAQTSNTKPFTPPPAPTPQSAQARAIAESTKASGKDAIPPLSSFLDVEKVKGLPGKEIEALWRLRHAGNPLSICATIPLDTYQRIAGAAKENPQFILPLPRQSSEAAAAPEGEKEKEKAGADIHFLQWAFHPPSPGSGASASNVHTSTVIFTHLAAYKSHGSYAQPHTTLTHHLDLADEKGLVLMHGQVMPDSGVNAGEASWLASCVQRFYDFGGQAEGRKGELVRMFTKGDAQGFKVEALLEEAEKL